MKVYFFPPTSQFNAYIDNIVNGLENNDVEIVNRKDKNKYDKFLSSIKAMLKHTDIYHFNWLENKSDTENIKNRIVCKLIFIWLRFIKLSGGKLAWTMHNKESHFCKGNKEFHYNFMRKFIAKMDMILVHAKETKQILIQEYGYDEKKICYVPQGNYLTDDDISSVPKIKKNDKFTILAFGMVNKYKNIPLLIKVFKKLNISDSKLKIYGKCDPKDRELKKEINENLKGSTNIEYEDRFVPENEINSIFENCDIVVLPYDKKSMMNSGAAVMAFSKAKPIIVSDFGSIKDIEDKRFVYSYDYESEKEHEIKLEEKIKQAYEIWQRDKEKLIEDGIEAFEYAKNDLSWNNICKKIKVFYLKIINNN